MPERDPEQGPESLLALTMKGWRIVSWGSDNHDSLTYTVHRQVDDQQVLLSVLETPIDEGTHYVCEAIATGPSGTTRSVVSDEVRAEPLSVEGIVELLRMAAAPWERRQAAEAARPTGLGLEEVTLPKSKGQLARERMDVCLRTCFDFEEDGIRPSRALIAERLHESRPRAMETLDDLERAGLLEQGVDGRLRLTDEGRARAAAIVRRHRLAELLLVNVIGMPYEEAHEEAAKWEHVMTENTERRIYELLGHPTRSPYGNPIPGVESLTDAAHAGTPSTDQDEQSLRLSSVTGSVVVRRIGEGALDDRDLLRDLYAAGVAPGVTVDITREGGHITVGRAGDKVVLSPELAAHVFVASATADDRD